MSDSTLSGKDLLLKALRNEETPRPAWVPFVGVHGAKMIGIPADEYLQSADRIVHGVCEAQRRYRPDGLPIVFDLQLEAEVLGCELRWAEETPPSVTSHPLVGRQLADLEPFDPGRGRFPIVVEALETVRERIGETTALYGLTTGPFTLALHLMGTEAFLAMCMEPEKVKDVLAFCARVGMQVADLYLEHGADVVAVVDPMTSQISPEHFEAFVAEPVDDVFRRIRDRGGLSSMFVCGDATRNLECMCRTQCDNVSVDENVSLSALKSLAEKHGRSIGGNLKLTSVLLLGDRDDARLDAIRCIDVGGTRGFILAPGCDLPYATPEANLEAVAAMVHDEYQRQVARATLHVKTATTADVELPDYANDARVIVDVITLDSASCAPCRYMMDAATEAAGRFGSEVVVQEWKIKTSEGLGVMAQLGVEHLPTICIDGQARFISITPDTDTLATELEEAVARKRS